MDITAGGTQPAHAKNEAFDNLERPSIWGELHRSLSSLDFTASSCPYMRRKSDLGYTCFQNRPNQGKYLKGEYGTDAESMDTRGPKVNGKVKEGHHVRTYVGKTRSIYDILH